MGNKSSVLEPKKLINLQKRTNFSQKRIKNLYNQFTKDFPCGFISFDEYKKNYTKLVPKGDLFSEHLFRCTDTNKDGRVDFDEFICMLNIASQQNLEEKIKWAFKMYDLDGSGTITRNEMIVIFSSIYKTFDDKIKNQNKSITPEKQADDVFRTMDKNNDNLITLDELMEAAKADQWIIQILNSF